MQNFLNISILSLTLTNIWIILYNNILSYLSFRFPPVVKAELLRNIAFPNPFKIPLYLMLTFVFIIGIWAFHKFFLKDTSRPVPTKIKIIVLLFLSLIFLSKLGSYPMAGDIFPYTLRPDPMIYNIVLIVYLSLAVIIIFELSIFFRLLKNSNILHLTSYILILFIIAFLTSEGRFPISGHDYSFFFGPILEISNGKTIYTDIPIQHGFLSILFFTLLYKLHILKLAYIPVFIWFLYILQYFLSFYLIYRVSKSLSLALIGLFSIITINYFSLSELPVSYPQIGPMRWLPSVILIFLFYKLKKIDHKLLIVCLGLLSLWLIDAGIAIILAYLFTLAILFLGRKINLQTAIKSGIALLASLFVIAATVNILHILFGYKSIDFINIFLTLNKYASLGIAQLPIESHTYFWIIIFIYFASVFNFFKNTFSPSNILHLTSNIIILFSANLMLFASIYYLGRAHPHNLFNISLLPILTLFLLIGIGWQELKFTRLKLALTLLLFILFIAYPAFMRKVTMTEMIFIKYKKLISGNIFTPEMDEKVSNRYSKERLLIQDKMTDKKIVILSNDDTYLFYLTQKKNLFDTNPQVGIDTKDDLDHALRNVLLLCPNTIAVDCAVFQKCPQQVGINQSGFYPASIILDQIQKKCRITYQPVECTNQLCIAQKK